MLKEYPARPVGGEIDDLSAARVPRVSIQLTYVRGCDIDRMQPRRLGDAIRRAPRRNRPAQ
ncbi:MAG: hypothetical protein GX535_17775 [Xanthomonadaceae bacterium]|nr:hypothetical protein [Xanthomonadaceae bacterium]